MKIIQSTDLPEAIAQYERLGYRLDMIAPADSPREVQLSKNNEIVRLILNREPSATPADGKSPDGWVNGRAGMMYRDLLPDRLGGRLIASHIRLSEGGAVSDYVHYHKIDFQLVYCLKGRIKVVYEDQGEPFWLEPGDCVLQAPEIRHRVLDAEAGSEVLELTSPAEHETWVEHDMALPTAEFKPERIFGGQRFVRSVANEASWLATETNGVEVRELGIADATDGLVDARIRRSTISDLMTAFSPRPGMIALGFVVAGREKPRAGSSETVSAVTGSESPTATDVLRIEFRDGHPASSDHA